MRRLHWLSVIRSRQLIARALKRLAYPRRLHKRYAKAFALYRHISDEVETFVRTPRTMKGPISLALDMLMTQAYKSYLSVYLLAEHAQVEDCATIVRRILELAARANWIAADPDEEEQKRRCVIYLRDMLDSLEEGREGGVSKQVIEAWRLALESVAIPLTKRGNPRKRPNFKEMFEAFGQLETYEGDYSFLSAIAHGSPDNQILEYSKKRIRLSQDEFVPILILYASRYYLAVFGVWNSELHMCSATKVDELIKLVDIGIGDIAA